MRHLDLRNQLVRPGPGEMGSHDRFGCPYLILTIRPTAVIPVVNRWSFAAAPPDSTRG